MPGVLAVLTGADMLADGLKPIPHAVWSRHPAELDLPEHRRLAEAPIPPHFCIGTDEVRHVGEIVAMVVAETVHAAKDAAEQVVVDYAPLPVVTHALPRRSRTRRSPAATPLQRLVDSLLGDAPATDAAFARAAHVVQLSTWIQRIAGVPMEPRAAVGEYDPATGRYTLHAGAGGAVRPKHDLVAVLGRRRRATLRMVMHDVGGNFGTRGAIQSGVRAGAWAARRVGRPVKWTCERSEAFPCDYQARDLAVTPNWRSTRTGTFLAMRGSNIVNDGAYPIAFGPLQQGRRDHVEHLPRAGRAVPRPRRADQHRADPPVSQLRPARGDVRDGAADRPRRAQQRLRPHRAAAAQPGARSRRCRTATRSAWSTTAATITGSMERVLELADWSGFPARRAEARGAAGNAAASALPTTSTPPPACRASAPRSPCSREGVVEVVIGTVSQRPGPRDQLRPARHRMARRAVRQRAPGHRRHRPRLGRRRLAFRPRAAARQHRHAERVAT